MSKGFLARLVLLVAISIAMVHAANALPFNDDMVNVQKRPGSMMRPKAPGSVPVGSSSYMISQASEAQNLNNPLKGDASSSARGHRLFTTNCSPCHGDITQKDWQPGPVGQKWLASLPGTTIADLRGNDPKRMKDYRNVTDGYIYGVIHFGFGLMSGYGWKLSPTEHWDIINYIRSVQSAH